MLGQFITHCEDSLTTSVFSHLLHLPSELFWQILRNACYSNDLPEHAGEPRPMEFQPRWNPAGTDNTTYVEPDVFLRFHHFDLIIEAKRWDDGQQNPDQWEKELISYTNEYGEEKRQVKMIALGGLLSTATETLRHEWRSPESESGDVYSHHFECQVIMCRWRGLLHQCKRMHRELSRLEYRDSRTFAHTRILKDVIELFSCHGYSTGRWFADFDFSRQQLSPSILPHLRLFRNRSTEFTQE